MTIYLILQYYLNWLNLIFDTICYYQSMFLMQMQIQIEMDGNLFHRDPQETALGKKIIQHSIQMINNYGFESFTFKILAAEIESREASIYRHFENKHGLLLYITAWYWSWLRYQIIYHTHKINNPAARLKKLFFFWLHQSQMIKLSIM